MNCSMLEYIPKLLQLLQHLIPNTLFHSPHPALEIKYSEKIQVVIRDNDAPVLDKEGKTLVRWIIKSLLLYARMMDIMLLVATSDLAL